MKIKTSVIALCALLGAFSANAKTYECAKSLIETEYQIKEWGSRAYVNLKADNRGIEVRPQARYGGSYGATLKFVIGYNDRIKYRGVTDSGRSTITLLTTPDKNGILGIKIERKGDTSMVFLECKRTDTTEFDDVLTKF